MQSISLYYSEHLLSAQLFLWQDSAPSQVNLWSLYLLLVFDGVIHTAVNKAGFFSSKDVHPGKPANSYSAVFKSRARSQGLGFDVVKIQKV